MDNKTMQYNISNYTSSYISDMHVLNRIVDISLPVTLVIIMVALGSALDINQLKKMLRSPLDLIIGTACQCIFLPLITFGIAHSMQMSDTFSLGMMLIGCCPGGVASNIFSYWADGDVPLSIGLTSVSNLMAIGTMPLNLFLYTRSWTNAELKIPYLNIAVSFLMVFVPVIVGMFLNWKWHKRAPLIIKIGSICGMATILLVTILLAVKNRRVFSTSWKPFFASFMMPFVAFVLGYMLSSIACLSKSKRKTIALETGIQNFPLCVTILNLSFKKELFINLAVYPLLYGIASIFDGLVFVVCCAIFNAIYNKRKEDEIEIHEVEELNQQDDLKS